MEEKRIYVVVAATVQTLPGGKGTVVQPYGRQIAQACHVVSKLRFVLAENTIEPNEFTPITTIILQGRDSNELLHVHQLSLKARLRPVTFADENPEVYGNCRPITAIAFLATKKQAEGIVDYIPLWGS
jgi:hypothetical protein